MGSTADVGLAAGCWQAGQMVEGTRPARNHNLHRGVHYCLLSLLVGASELRCGPTAASPTAMGTIGPVIAAETAPG